MANSKTRCANCKAHISKCKCGKSEKKVTPHATKFSDKHREFICQRIALGDVFPKIQIEFGKKFKEHLERHHYRYVKEKPKWTEYTKACELRYSKDIGVAVPLARKHVLADSLARVFEKSEDSKDYSNAIKAGSLMAEIMGFKSHKVEQKITDGMTAAGYEKKLQNMSAEELAVEKERHTKILNDLIAEGAIKIPTKRSKKSIEKKDVQEKGKKSKGKSGTGNRGKQTKVSSAGKKVKSIPKTKKQSKQTKAKAKTTKTG